MGFCILLSPLEETLRFVAFNPVFASNNQQPPKKEQVSTTVSTFKKTLLHQLWVSTRLITKTYL